MISIDSTSSRPREADLLLRYDVAGPRYTSYPTAPQFRTDFGESHYQEHARRSNATFTPRPLSLYVHAVLRKPLLLLRLQPAHHT